MDLALNNLQRLICHKTQLTIMGQMYFLLFTNLLDWFDVYFLLFIWENLKFYDLCSMLQWQKWWTVVLK